MAKVEKAREADALKGLGEPIGQGARDKRADPFKRERDGRPSQHPRRAHAGGIEAHAVACLGERAAAQEGVHEPSRALIEHIECL